MNIRKCPDCAQMTHFDNGERAPLFCWSCATRVDFAALPTPEQRLVSRATAAFDRALPHPSRLVRAGKIALVVAMPIAVVMLLVCNDFNIWIVRDAAAPFLLP